MKGSEDKKGLSTTTIVLIVVGAVVALAVVGVVIMGITFLWANSFTSDSGNEVTYLNLHATIDGTTDTLELEVISGNVNWNEQRVVVDGHELTTLSSDSGPGDTAMFTGMMWDPEAGKSYRVSVYEYGSDIPRWEEDIPAI
ncbi:MAG: hypothetical protein ACMUFK_03550 [Thermoplasmatota archaeon]